MQYFKKKVEGFSTYVCLLLLVAAVLRIVYWYVFSVDGCMQSLIDIRFMERFQIALLLQSVLLAFAQLMMLRKCISSKKYDDRCNISILDVRPSEFWKWTHFEDYVFFVAVLFIASSVAAMLLHDFEWFQSGIGFTALACEAMAALPQVIENWRRGTTEGVSAAMIASWGVGDAFKLIYYSSHGAPTPFLACGMVQVSLDMVLGMQMVSSAQRLEAEKQGLQADIEVPGSPSEVYVATLANGTSAASLVIRKPTARFT